MIHVLSIWRWNQSKQSFTYLNNPHQGIFRFSNASSKSRRLLHSKQESLCELQHSANWKGKEQVKRTQWRWCRGAAFWLLTTESRWQWEFSELLYSLRLGLDHSVSELLSHLSPQPKPAPDSTGKQGKETILDILIKAFPLQFHLKKARDKLAQTSPGSMVYYRRFL